MYRYNDLSSNYLFQYFLDVNFDFLSIHFREITKFILFRLEFVSFRQCNGSSTGYEGCEYLCCSRGHVTRTEEVLERCDCKYISCCYVKCKTCRKVMKTYECKWIKMKGIPGEIFRMKKNYYRNSSLHRFLTILRFPVSDKILPSVLNE